MLAIVYYYLTFCIKSVCKCWIINSNPVIWAIGILANVHKEEHYLCCCSLVAQSCSTLCDPLDYSLLGLSVHGILQARILQWGGISLSRVSFWPRNGTCVSCFTGGFFTTELPGKPGIVCTHKKLEVWSWNIPTGDWLNASSIFWKTPRVKYYTNTEKRIRHICVYRQRRPMAPHSSTLAWKIPWAEEPGRLQSMGLQRVVHDWATSLSLFTFMHWRRKWQPTPVFLPGESQGRGSLVGCLLWGGTESDMTEVT